MFIPTCFWSRLFTRLIGDEQLTKNLTEYFLVDLISIESKDCLKKIHQILLAECSWIVCQTSLELRYYDCCLLKISQVSSTESNDDELFYSYKNRIFQFDTDEEKNKQLTLFNESGSLIEIILCSTDLQMIIAKNDDEQSFIFELYVQKKTIARLWTLIFSHVDSLLEDWYPEMGTRFVQNAKGDYLINRFLPCHRCLFDQETSEKSIIHVFWFETLLMFIEKQNSIQCPKHGEFPLDILAPDLVSEKFRLLMLIRFLFRFQLRSFLM